MYWETTDICLFFNTKILLQLAIIHRRKNVFLVLVVALFVYRAFSVSQYMNSSKLWLKVAMKQKIFRHNLKI